MGLLDRFKKDKTEIKQNNTQSVTETPQDIMKEVEEKNKALQKEMINEYIENSSRLQQHNTSPGQKAAFDKVLEMKKIMKQDMEKMKSDEQAPTIQEKNKLMNIHLNLDNILMTKMSMKIFY